MIAFFPPTVLYQQTTLDDMSFSSLEGDSEDSSAFCQTRPNGSVWEELEWRTLEYGRNLIPYQIFISLVVVIGIIGNISVLVVYGKKSKKTSSTQFILFMAVTDLFAITVVVSFLLIELYRHYIYFNDTLCKLYEWSRHSVITVSICGLVCVAFDRYLAIRNPINFRSYDERTKYLIMGCLMVGFVLQTPCFFLFGHKTHRFANSTVIGCGCGIRDRYNGKIFHQVFRGYLLSMYVIMGIIIVTLYVRIYVLFHSREKQIRRRTSSMTSSHGVTISDEVLSAQIERTSRANGDIRERGRCGSCPCLPISKLKWPIIRRHRIEPQSQANQNNGHHVTFTLIARYKLAKMLLTVTVTFLATWLPYWLVVIATTRDRHFWSGQPFWRLNILLTFRNFYFVNNAVNPVIYAILNKEFRTKLKSCLKR